MTKALTPTGLDWTVTDPARIQDAARRAPRWGTHQPWTLELAGRTVRLFEHAPPSMLWHGAGTERLLACGAALTNIRLAVRTADWRTDTRFVQDRDRPDLVATVSAQEILPPTQAEAHRFAAIYGLVRIPVPRGPVSPAGLRAIAAASSWCPGVELRRIDDEGRASLVVLTTDDARLDRVRAGAALQAACLTARAVGLIARPVIEPLWRPGVRAGLIERLTLAGYPQALLRIESRFGGTEE